MASNVPITIFICGGLYGCGYDEQYPDQEKKAGECARSPDDDSQELPLTPTEKKQAAEPADQSQEGAHQGHNDQLNGRHGIRRAVRPEPKGEVGVGWNQDADPRRQANVEDLNLPAARLAVTPKGILSANQFCQTDIPHIYAVGDMVSGPALASKAMEQGRRAVRHALDLPIGDAASTIPLGIYTIPEMASIGLD